MASTDPVAALIERKLTEALAPTSIVVEVVDASSAKYSVTVVAEAFRGKTLVARHRAVNDALKEELQSTIHALTISAQVPAA